ncbi:hypothetical protein CRENBAI_004078 [Crenichthys baileyi]|uniref:Uncharacterized protein n=1 Tax=Crenichthys baileyi TaxID=28760 RepID=A0AAV9RND6_9TELE
MGLFEKGGMQLQDTLDAKYYMSFFLPGLWSPGRAVAKMQQSSASPVASNQLQQWSPYGAVHGAEENKSFKAEALYFASLVRGGADLGRGRHHVYLIQLGCLQGLPWDLPGRSGAVGLSNKDVEPSPLPCTESTSLVSRVSLDHPKLHLYQHEQEEWIL